MAETTPSIDALARDVRVHLFDRCAATGRVPQAAEIAAALSQPEPQVRAALHHLAAGKALIMAPYGDVVWAANPFCAVPSGIRVATRITKYWAICAWDALGIAAAVKQDAEITAPCGDCGEPMTLEIRNGELARAEGLVHFAVPAHHWWDNIGFT